MAILIEKNIMVPMRDGVKLATDLYRQDGETAVPVLVTRTPYNKNGILGGGFDIIRAVQAGFAVAVQDVRGRFASEGTFTAHFQEINDGLDVDITRWSRYWQEAYNGVLMRMSLLALILGAME
mgnify:CR=1 FL=1